jgi:hypothetical protein
MVISHDLYHAGEINRQREMIRGTDRLGSLIRVVSGVYSGRNSMSWQ